MAAPLASQPQIIVFFDGVCHLCNGFVDFAISRDRRRRLRFAPLQGKNAEKLLPVIFRAAPPDSVIWWTDGEILTETAAVARVLRALDGPWPALGWLLTVLPSFLTNPVYRWIARNRLRWFGERDTCRLPAPGERDRLLD